MLNIPEITIKPSLQLGVMAPKAFELPPKLSAVTTEAQPTAPTKESAVPMPKIDNTEAYSSSEYALCRSLAKDYQQRHFTEKEAVMLIKKQLPPTTQVNLAAVVTKTYAEELQYPALNNKAMAEYCLQELDQRLLKVIGRDEFWLWENGRWQTKLPEESVNKIMLDRLNRQPGVFNPQYREKFEAWLGKTNNITATLHYLKMLCGKVQPGAINKEPHLFNMQNGVFDLKRMQIRLAQPDEYLVQFANVVYDDQARCPEWEDFVWTVVMGDEELYHYLQMMSGYFLWGANPLRRIFVFTGKSNNGKSTFFKVMAKLLGDYYTPIKDSTVLAKKWIGKGDDLMALLHKRLYVLAEMEEGARFDGPLVKAIAGSETQLARENYQNFTAIALDGKIVIHTNEIPRIADSSDGFFNRLNIIKLPFAVAQNQEDIELKERLSQELPGIFNWAVAGIERAGPQWRNFRETAGMMDMKKSYRNQNDTVQSFLDECYEISDTQRTRTKDVYEDYHAWMQQHYPSTHEQASATYLKGKLENKGIRYLNSNGTWFYLVKKASLDVTDD
jgi:putative DNA primase/helicase